MLLLIIYRDKGTVFIRGVKYLFVALWLIIYRDKGTVELLRDIVEYYCVVFNCAVDKGTVELIRDIVDIIVLHLIVHWWIREQWISFGIL